MFNLVPEPSCQRVEGTNVGREIHGRNGVLVIDTLLECQEHLVR